jgi:hypothetical protein
MLRDALETSTTGKLIWGHRSRKVNEPASPLVLPVTWIVYTPCEHQPNVNVNININVNGDMSTQAQQKPHNNSSLDCSWNEEIGFVKLGEVETRKQQTNKQTNKTKQNKTKQTLT